MQSAEWHAQFYFGGEEESGDEMSGIIKALHQTLIEPRSLDAPAFRDPELGDVPLASFVPSDAPSPFDEADRDMTSNLLFTIMREVLTERERHVLIERFWNDRRLESVGEDIGVCRERVRQIQNEALRTLRNAFLERGISQCPSL